MKISLNAKLKPFATIPMRYKVAYGGRGSSKSWTIARILLLKAMEKPIRVLCLREIQDSIKDSVHKLLKDQIDLLELQGFTVQNDSIKHENGSEFLFKGLYSNLSKIKSFEGVDIAWIEEGESISALSWQILDPTIRKPNSEIWISFNPRYENDVIYSNFVINSPDNAIVIKVNWNDNKYFPKELEKQKDTMAINDPDLYLHIWEGQLKKNTSELIFNNKWLIDEFDTPDNIHFYYGADWGFSQDPNTVNRAYIGKYKDMNNCLFLDYEINDRPYSLEQIKQWNDNGEFVINDRTYKLTGLSHQFRVEVLSIYSQIEANIIMGNYQFLQRDDFKKVMTKVDDRVLYDGMQLSKLPKHFEEYAEDYLDYIAISMKVIVYPFYCKKLNQS